jgi:concanavalin A-like lectin/glucanase superfamily protein
VRPERPARELVIPGTLAYWRLDGAVAKVTDLSGRGNDLTPVLLPGSPADSLRLSTEHHPDQPAHASWLFAGGKDPGRGGYLRTADNAPLNRQTFRTGYTLEAFAKLADDGADHSWEGLLSRLGTGAEVGKTGSDPSEPVAKLGFSGGRQVQWAVYPLDRNDTFTNWGHEQVAGRWFHLAVVNDGRHSTVYVDSSELLRNPATRSNGLSTTGASWLLGAGHYAQRRPRLRRLDRRRPHRRPRSQAVPIPQRLTPPNAPALASGFAPRRGVRSASRGPLRLAGSAPPRGVRPASRGPPRLAGFTPCYRRGLTLTRGVEPPLVREVGADEGCLGWEER